MFLSLSLLIFLQMGVSPSRSYPRSFLSVGPVGTTDYPWDMFHFGAGRNGTTPASGPTSASLMWTYPTGSIVYGSPVVSDGFVFIPSYDGKLYAIDEYTGSLIWSFTTGSNIGETAPAVGNGMVYLSSKDFTLYALDENTGSVIWRISNVAPVVSSPVLADGILFYGTLYSPSAGRAEFLAVNPQDGTVLWRKNVDDYIQGSASVANGRVFFGKGAITSPVIMARNETTGISIWNYSTAPLMTTITGAPALAYGNVYVGLDSTRFLALSQATGGLVWSFNTPNGSNATTPAIYNGVVYFGTGRGIVYARNATTGVQIWSYTTPTGGAVASSPAIALGSKTLFFGSNDRYMYALNMMTGAFLWRYLTGGQVSSSPAVADSRVFFGAKDAKVYALGIIIPQLQATISASPAVLRSLMVSNLTVTVRNSTGPIAGANLTFTSSTGGTFSQPVMTIPGTYLANITVPMVSSSRTDVIQVVVSASGYLNAVASTNIIVNPFPPLAVAVAARPGTTTPGGEVLLMIRVTNGTDLVPGASLTMSSSQGGSFSGLTDSGNGNYTTIYTSPLVSSTNVITVQASKNRFSSAQGQVVVTVTGIPDLTTVKVAGLPLFLFAAAAVLIFFLLIAIAVTRRDRSRARIPPQPSFTY